MDFLIGGLAACGASVFSNPFDVIKTRMQLQGELRARGQHTIFYKNVFHGGWAIAKNEGIRGMQKGLLTACFMHSVRNSTRLGLYQTMDNNNWLRDENGKTIFWRSALAGSFTGGVGAFFGSPFFMVKTQLQSQSAEQIAVGTQHNHRGAAAALIGIYKNYGILGLWRGSESTVLRALLGSPAQLTSFVIFKDILSEKAVFKDSVFLTSFVSSFFCGIVQTLFITPFDLVSTRLFNQGVDKTGKGLLYDNLFDCFVKIWRIEGFLGFYKGIGPNYMRLAPHAALCMVFWDLLKDMHRKYSQNL